MAGLHAMFDDIKQDTGHKQGFSVYTAAAADVVSIATTRCNGPSSFIKRARKLMQHVRAQNVASLFGIIISETF